MSAAAALWDGRRDGNEVQENDTNLGANGRTWARQAGRRTQPGAARPGLARAASPAQAAVAPAGAWLPERRWPPPRRTPSARGRSPVAGTCRRWASAGGRAEAAAARGSPEKQHKCELTAR
jgi:hypothetical protein